jgi:hypothetical protein
MLRIPIRVLAGVLAVLLLPVFALAAENNSNAPANKNAETENAAAIPAAPAPAPAAGVAAVNDPLVRLLVSKGLLSVNEASSLASAPANEVNNRLLMILKDKGLISADDLNSLKAPGAATATASMETAAQGSTTPPPAAAPQAPATPAVIPAVAPIRVLQVDPAKHEGFIPDIKIGKGVNIKPYGFVKASAVYDTSSPYGNDFPLPGFIGDINGPDAFPEFHIKARFIRFGSNFEWLDTPNVVITGKVEADFEGNFGRSNNRNISSLRSNMFQFRLGYGRIDWKQSDTNSIFFLAGQDWTPFASSTLPNLFETTGLGVSFGTLYERAPQFRVGLEHKLGGARKFAIAPEFAIVLPAYGNLPTDLVAAGAVVPNNEGIGNQLGFGERQGVDSAKPEVQARLVTQFQLDSAPGVAPAQIIVSGVHGTRSAKVLAAAVPAAFKAAFPTGVDVESNRNGWTGEIQLPTRFVTVIAKYWNGSDMRFYFGNELISNFNNTTGLTGTATAQSIDGSSTVVFGLLNGVPTVAPQLPLRGQGGFVNLGFPLSRIFNADPAGRNAGWQLYLHYGLDNALARDIRRVGGGRQKSDMAAGTLNYKLNNFVTFTLEESLYRTRAIPLTSTGLFPSFDGRPNREWKDFRSEFGPIFSF